MTSRKIIFISIALIILFASIGWVVSPYIMHYIASYLVSITKDVKVISTSIHEQYNMQLKSALSIAMVPVFVMMVTLLIQKFRKKAISTWDYFFYFSIIIIAYILGAVFKFYALEATVQQVVNYKISPEVINSLPLNQVLVYDWGFYMSLIASILITLIAKRKKAT
jgi:hypothetical protein